MKSVSEIIAERDSRIMAIRAEYTAEENKISMIGDAAGNVRAEELRRRVLGVSECYKGAIIEAERYEREWVDCNNPTWMDEFFRLDAHLS